jgi:hypothetical protein
MIDPPYQKHAQTAKPVESRDEEKKKFRGNLFPVEDKPHSDDAV